jgi:hypothetical protein
MSILREAKSLRDKSLELLAMKSVNSFTFEHDKLFNLTITFSDGEVVRIPIIDLRPYQLELQMILMSGEYKRVLVEWPRRRS